MSNPSKPPCPDMSSLDGVIAALYASISGPAGPRDWDRLRCLFLPGSRLVRSAMGPSGSAIKASTVEEFIADAAPKLQSMAFYEKEIVRHVERFGCIAHVFSVYAARFTADESEPPLRGINSVQLIENGGRWWVVSLLWDDERPENRIPARLLGHQPPTTA